MSKSCPVCYKKAVLLAETVLKLDALQKEFEAYQNRSAHVSFQGGKAWGEAVKRIEFLELSLVQLWHTSPEAVPLQELLGFTPEQYRDWLKGRAANPPDSTAPRTPGSDSSQQ